MKVHVRVLEGSVIDIQPHGANQTSIAVTLQHVLFTVLGITCYFYQCSGFAVQCLFISQGSFSEYGKLGNFKWRKWAASKC